MKFKELTTKGEAENKKLLEELVGRAHDLRVKARLGQLKGIHELKAIRRDIARLKTHLKQAATRPQ